MLAAKRDFFLHVGREMNRSQRRRSSRTAWAVMSCVLFVLRSLHACCHRLDVAHTCGPWHGDHGTETAVLIKVIKVSGLTNGFVLFLFYIFPPKVPPSFPHGLNITEDLAGLHQESGKAPKRLFIAFYSSPATFSFNTTALALF